MKIEKPDKRMTLRQLMTHSEKCTRDLIEHFHSTILATCSDFRDLTRPVRRRSHYPTYNTILNSLRKLEEAGEEAMVFSDYLLEQLQVICTSGHKEHLQRRRI